MTIIKNKNKEGYIEKGKLLKEIRKKKRKDKNCRKIKSIGELIK